MKTVAFIFGFMFIILSGHAQKSEFRIEVSNDTVLEGNYIIVKYTIKNIEGNFVAPDFKDFDVIGGPMSSNMFSMVNGQSTRESSYKYYLKPKKTGKSYIEPATIGLDNQLFDTSITEIVTIPNPEKIKVEPKLQEEENSIFDFRINGDDGIDTPANNGKPKKNIEIKKI